MNGELSEQLSLALTVLGTLTLIVSPFALGYLTLWLRGRVKNEKYDKLVEMIYESVKGAEGLFPGDNNGASKKAYVMKVLRWAANEVIGMNVSDEFLSTLVESAVYWLFNQKKKSATIEPASAIEPAPVAYKGK